MRYGRALGIADRHSRLIEFIRSGAHSSRTLAENLGVSEQTIYRDIEYLKQSGYSIRPERNARGWAYHLLAEPATAANGKGTTHK